MADEVLVWCDVRKNIGVLQFILGLKEPEKTENNGPECVEITVKRDRVVVKKKEKGNDQLSEGKQAKSSSKRNCILFQDVRLDPITCNGLCLVQDKELQMRLRINADDTSNVQNIFSQMNGYNDVPLEEERRDLKKAHVQMHCKMCLDRVTEDIQFDRVLELPSELWQKISLNLCCHGTISNLSSLQEGSLNPADKDCLLGSYFILLHISAVKSKHLDLMGNRAIKCHRCNWPLGDLVLQHDGTCTSQSQIQCVRINKHAITTSLGADNIFSEYTTELYLSRLLLSKLQGRVNFKFLVKITTEKGPTQSCAILWILNPDAAVVTNITRRYIDGCSIKEDDKNSKEIKAKFMKGVKILYQVLLKSSDEEIRNLPGRSTMETLHLSQEEFLQLVLLLTSSTYTLPPSQRQVQDFTVGSTIGLPGVTWGVQCIMGYLVEYQLIDLKNGACMHPMYC